MFHVHRQSSVPLTEQICQEFADRIKSGILEPESRLPSVRELSETLGVSLVTVVQAYKLLEQEGLVNRIHGKGTYVRYGENAHRAANGRFGGQAGGQPYDWQLSISDYLPRASVLGPRTGAAQVPFKMSMAALDPRLSEDVMSEGVFNLIQKATRAVSEYGPVEGIEQLRNSVSDYLREHGLIVHADDTLITNGVQQAIDLVARTFVGPGDVVIVEAPTYSGAIDVFRSRGATVVSIPMDDEGLRVDLLLKQCDHAAPKLIYTMPTFQNPTGIVMSQRRRAALLDIAESYQCLIFEDDSFSDCSFIGAPPAPIYAMDRAGHVIYVKGFSKVFCAGSRIAAVVSSGSIRNRLVAAKSVSDLGSPILTQLYMQVCMNQPNRRERIQAISHAVRRKRDIALRVLAENAPLGVRWTVPDGGYNIWITLPLNTNTDSLLIYALQQGVSFLPGSACYANDTVNHQLRISVASLDDESLQEGVSRLCQMLREVLSIKQNILIPSV